jgi:hypothetical protein
VAASIPEFGRALGAIASAERGGICSRVAFGPLRCFCGDETLRGDETSRVTKSFAGDEILRSRNMVEPDTLRRLAPDRDLSLSEHQFIDRPTGHFVTVGTSTDAKSPARQG